VIDRVRTLGCALAAIATMPAHAASSDPRETQPFVLTYRCDDSQAIAVAYPAFRDAASQPIRLAWQQNRYVLYHAPSGSGARYLTRDGRYEWWTKGNEGSFAVPGVNPPILANCAVF
jgi:membrane-bound inhibitor of C-type lysozyme